MKDQKKKKRKEKKARQAENPKGWSRQKLGTKKRRRRRRRRNWKTLPSWKLEDAT